MDYVHSSLFITSYRKILLWVLYWVVLFPLVAILNFLWGDKYPILNRMQSRFILSTTILFWIGCLLPFELSSLYELISNHDDLPFEVLSRCFAGFFLGICFASLISVTAIILKNMKHQYHP